MVPTGALDAPASVIYLPKHKAAGVAAAPAFVVRDAVLFFAQQNISGIFAAYTGEKTASRGKKSQINPFVRAFSHQCRTCAFVGKAQDALERMQWKLTAFLFTRQYKHRLAVKGKVAVLAQDE